MHVIPFVAESAADAVGQIRSRLGPDAIVLNVRKLAAPGLARLWQRPRIEVLAGVPEKSGPSSFTSAHSEPVRSALLDVREAADAVLLPTAPIPNDDTAPASLRTTNRFVMPELRPGEWRSTALLLGTMGVSALNTERVLERLKHQHGEQPPALLGAELALTQSMLASFWKQSTPAPNGLHVFIGAPGCGKTTAICKWLTQAVLLDGASARVWRLDVPRANTAEALSVYCEILNVAVERVWKPGVKWAEDHVFIDLPGVEAGHDAALTELGKLLSTMPGASVSLVLNAAYDLPLLQAQVRAFAGLPLTDLIFTHLDEEPRWSKLWNFVLGTNYSLSFLSAGQNIPGQFIRATSAVLFPEQMRASA